MEELQLGQYAFPVILTIILGMIYKIIPSIPDRIKVVISVLVAMTLSLIPIAYKGILWTFPVIVDHLLYGIMAGASAAGIYELSRAIRNPRE